MGNSHSIGLSTILATLLSRGQIDKAIDVQIATGSGFLADRVSDGSTRASLESSGWSHVILQAQKYSSTGENRYPTAAAEYWIRGSKLLGATPILFPEHPRRGNTWEGQFLQDLHRSIAQSEAAWWLRLSRPGMKSFFSNPSWFCIKPMAIMLLKPACI